MARSEAPPPTYPAQGALFDVPLRARREVLTVLGSGDPLGLIESKRLIRELWEADVHSGDMARQTFTRYWQLLDSFFAYAMQHECATLDEAAHVYDLWLNSHGSSRTGARIRPGMSVRHLRSCAVRACFRTARFLGLATAHPAYIPGDNEVTRSGRPLNEVEAEILRHTVGSEPTSRVPAAVALALAGAGTADIGSVLVGDVDLDDGTILLRGGTRTRSRRVAIPGEWEFNTLQRRVTKMRKRRGSEDQGLIVRRSGGESSRQAGAAIALTQATDRAGLTKDGDVKPASLQRWAATVAFDATGNIADAAALLGTTSLDTASQAVGWDWSTTPATVNPPRPDYRPRVVR